VHSHHYRAVDSVCFDDARSDSKKVRKSEIRSNGWQEPFSVQKCEQRDN
jgi:hypothetical protein